MNGTEYMVFSSANTFLSSYPESGSILKDKGECQGEIDCGPYHPGIHSQSKRGDDTKQIILIQLPQMDLRQHIIAHSTARRMICCYINC